MRELTVRKNDSGQRLDKFLQKALPSLPPALLYKSIRLKKIKVNRKRAEGAQVLCEGDTLQLFLAEEFFTKKKNSALWRITPRISVLYEDENILLLNKRAGVSVHEDENGDGNTLLLHLQAYLFQKGEYDPEREQSFAPALCNRIDRNTAGIVIAAKNAEALRVMNEKIKSRELHKYYLCAVHGVPSPAAATLSAYLLKNEKDKTVRVFDKNPPRGAKEIRTRYRTVAVKDGDALLEVELLTGRTHQIRAHMAHVGHPLLGDGKYGINRADRQRGYHYQALCSYRLTFDFAERGTLLDYLDGKSFGIPPADIYFVTPFDVKGEL
ncbi:MAG: RluA family pseudouridine synthase [Clostridia bacterium]|nr:RluA family pseudouridine synthase [Clostridia bacterium]